MSKLGVRLITSVHFWTIVTAWLSSVDKKNSFFLWFLFLSYLGFIPFHGFSLYGKLLCILLPDLTRLINRSKKTLLVSLRCSILLQRRQTQALNSIKKTQHEIVNQNSQWPTCSHTVPPERKTGGTLPPPVFLSGEGYGYPYAKFTIIQRLSITSLAENWIHQTWGRCLLIQRYICSGLWLCRKCRS